MPIAVPTLVIVGTMVGVDVGPDAVTASPVIAFASPKSKILTSPPSVILTFAGLRSRWTIPRSCAYSRPSAIFFAMPIVSSSGSGAPLDPGFERLTGDQLHRQEANAALVVQTEDRGDVGMMELRQHLRFTLES